MSDAERLVREELARHLAKKADEMFLRAHGIESRPARPSFDIRREIAESGSRSGLHCPGCRSANLWVESGDGDYYQGPTYWCRPPGCDQLWSIQ